MIDPAAVAAYDFGERVQHYQARDAILYALGLGVGGDPLAPAQLRFLDERALTVLPSFAVTLCSPGMWIRDPRLGVDFAQLVHLAQEAEFLAPLPDQATAVGLARVAALLDRGAGRGAELVLERTILDQASGALLCRLRQTLLLRGDGGFGGPPAPRHADAPPDRAADFAVSAPTSPRAALIYRLSGDWNPLHLDPAVAAAAGFARPILHGLASYGMAALAVSEALGRDPAAVASLSCRFAGVVLPGETIDFSIWEQGGGSADFSARVGDRAALAGGRIVWRRT